MRQNGTPRRLRRDCRSPRPASVALLPFLSAASLAAGIALPISARANDQNSPVIPASPPSASGATTAPAEAAPRIVFAGTPLPVASPDLAPYRDPADGILCVSPQSLSPLGVTYIIDRTANVVAFSGPDGVASATVGLRTPPAGLAGGARRGPFVPVNDVIEGLGGKCQWYPATNTLVARAVLTSIEILGGQLRIQATLPVSPTITSQNEGRQIVIDIPGAEIGKLPHTIDLQSPLVSQDRVGQFNDDTARIVLEMKHPFAFSVLGGKPSLTMVLNPTTPPNAAVIAAAATTPAAPPSGKKSGHGKVAPISLVSGVTYKKISDVEAQFVISADRAPTIRAGLTNGRLTLDLLNATLGSHAADLADFAHPFLKEAHLIANGASAAQLVLDLTRAVVFTIRPSDKGPVELDLSLPRGAVGKLSGKTIVVDPGHGGHDSGAMGVNGTSEKSVNLQIATQVAASLRDAGANVILTRSSDYFIPVDDRPAIANRAGADFFVSIHADSGDRNHSVAGSTVYYHFNQPSCKTLAQCIADRLSGSSDIHSRGVGSDGNRFPGVGYGVLRNSQMVAVLVECGYMSNMGDVRKLNTPATQQKIALAVVNGLRDYIEGNPQTDTRNINPQAGGGITPVPTVGGTDSPTTGANPGTTPPATTPGSPVPVGLGTPQATPVTPVNTPPNTTPAPTVPPTTPPIPDDSIVSPQ